MAYMTLETIALFLGRIDHPLKKLIKKKCRITFFWGPPNPQNKVSLLIIIKKKKYPHNHAHITKPILHQNTMCITTTHTLKEQIQPQ